MADERQVLDLNITSRTYKGMNVEMVALQLMQIRKSNV